MNAAQQRFKDWILSHVQKPEAMSEGDYKILDFIIVSVPSFAGLIISFTLLSAIYLWGLKKYGFDRTLVVMLVGIMISIGQVSGAIKALSQ